MKTLSEKSADAEQVADTRVYLQDAYSLRCVPQILGPVRDTIAMARKVVEEEINSCNDNPLIFDTPEELFHGGNFHGQYVAMYSDFLNVALTEIGVLAERQLNRLVDPHLNNCLPPFLAAAQAGLFSGFEGGQYLATSIASENLDLATPSSVKSIPSNGANQDVVSMGLNAARKSLQLCENVTTILAVLVSACYQASHFIDQGEFSPAIKQWHQLLGSTVSLYRDEFPISQHIGRVRDLLISDQVASLLDTLVLLDE
jgi:histidine ammonia-lyase/tyrosine ammonia-lyase